MRQHVVQPVIREGHVGVEPDEYITPRRIGSDPPRWRYSTGLRVTQQLGITTRQLHGYLAAVVDDDDLTLYVRGGSSERPQRGIQDLGPFVTRGDDVRNSHCERGLE